MGFDFRRAPGKLDFRLNPLLFQVAFSEVYHFGGNSLAGEVLDRLDRGCFRDSEHPSRRLAGRLAKEEFTDLVDVRVVLLDPIMPGDAAVEISMFNVPADL